MLFVSSFRVLKVCFESSVLVVALAGCGSNKGGPVGTGASSSSMITAEEGGTVTLEGTTLDVPPGAIPADTVITITSSTTSPTGFTSWNSPVYKFDPDGLVFLSPVRVSIMMTGSAAHPAIHWSRAGGGFDDLGGTVASGQISTYVVHFSEGFAAPSTGIDSGTPVTDGPVDGHITPPGTDGGNPPGGDGGTGGDGGPGHDGGITPPGGDGGVPGDGGITPPTGDGGVGHDGGGGIDGGITPPGGDGGLPPPGGDGGVTPPTGDGGVPPTSDGGTPPPPPLVDAGGPPPTPP